MHNRVATYLDDGRATWTVSFTNWLETRQPNLGTVHLWREWQWVRFSLSRNNHLFLITCNTPYWFQIYSSSRRVVEQPTKFIDPSRRQLYRAIGRFFTILSWAYESHLNRRRIQKYRPIVVNFPRKIWWELFSQNSIQMWWPWEREAAFGSHVKAFSIIQTIREI